MLEGHATVRLWPCIRGSRAEGLCNFPTDLLQNQPMRRTSERSSEPMQEVIWDICNPCSPLSLVSLRTVVVVLVRLVRRTAQLLGLGCSSQMQVGPWKLFESNTAFLSFCSFFFPRGLRPSPPGHGGRWGPDASQWAKAGRLPSARSHPHAR